MQAALLAGLSLEGLFQVAVPKGAPYAATLMYMLATIVSLCLLLISVMNTTLLAMMGPGLALRGPEGSMHPAVDGMRIEYQTTYTCFVLGIVSLTVSLGLYGWMMLIDWRISTVLTLLSIGALFFLAKFANRMNERFHLDASEETTGRFEVFSTVFSALSGRWSASGKHESASHREEDSARGPGNAPAAG
jgi:hypothetical protein